MRRFGRACACARTRTRLPQWQRTVSPQSVQSTSQPPRSFPTSSENCFSSRSGGGGFGIGNVQDRVLPTCRVDGSKPLYRHIAKPHTVSIIGAPMTYGQPYVGTDNGPKLLRDAGLRTKLTHLGWRVEDNPDLDMTAESLMRLPPPTFLQTSSHTINPSGGDGIILEDHPDAKNSQLVGRGAALVADMVYQKASAGRFPLVLGGDHSVALGSLFGIRKARPHTGILWIDAHADLNTPSTSESGNMHGMPLGMLLEGLHVDYDTIPGCEWLGEASASAAPRRIPADSIVYVGLRDVDAKERKTIREHNIKAFTMHDIDKYGIGQTMEMALSHLLAEDAHRPLHVSFDIDAVDPALAPATGTAVRGGLTFREAHYVAEAVAASGAMASADVVELNPTLADGEGAKETLDLGLHLITSLMGKSII